MSSTFATPTFDLWPTIYICVGAAILWGLKGGAKNLRAYCLSPIVDLVFGPDYENKWRNLVEFFIFLVIGVVVVSGLTHPQNAGQAIAAGLGWTGLASHATPRSRNQKPRAAKG
ncbi:hypothetical protein [Burkholderia pseudomallei]|uniref:hypothetical protein n=1 Tax=Burkholderia pseudomallei TaxID=28450 RepID=UPI0011AB335F|nr:hypothetical protein [Burkholderia pseudomallei]